MSDDPHKIDVVTYRSANAAPARQWLAFLVMPSGRLPITFFAATETEAVTKAHALWDSERDAREVNHQRRQRNKPKTGTVIASPVLLPPVPVPAPNLLAGLLPR